MAYSPDSCRADFLLLRALISPFSISYENLFAKILLIISHLHNFLCEIFPKSLFERMPSLYLCVPL